MKIHLCSYYEFEVHSLLLVASVASDIHSIPIAVATGLNCTEKQCSMNFKENSEWCRSTERFWSLQRVLWPLSRGYWCRKRMQLQEVAVLMKLLMPVANCACFVEHYALDTVVRSCNVSCIKKLCIRNCLNLIVKGQGLYGVRAGKCV